MLTAVLLIVCGVFVLGTLASLLGVELPGLDVDLGAGDGAIGVLTLLAPAVAVATGTAGLLLLSGTDSTTVALLAGLGAGLLTAAIMYLVAAALLAGQSASETTALPGAPGRVVETVAPGRLGTVEVVTANGSMLITATPAPGTTAPLGPGAQVNLTTETKTGSNIWEVVSWTPPDRP